MVSADRICQSLQINNFFQIIAPSRLTHIYNICLLIRAQKVGKLMQIPVESAFRDFVLLTKVTPFDALPHEKFIVQQ